MNDDILKRAEIAASHQSAMYMAKLLRDLADALREARASLDYESGARDYYVEELTAWLAAARDRAEAAEREVERWQDKFAESDRLTLTIVRERDAARAALRGVLKNVTSDYRPTTGFVDACERARRALGRSRDVPFACCGDIQFRARMVRAHACCRKRRVRRPPRPGGGAMSKRDGWVPCLKCGYEYGSRASYNSHECMRDEVANLRAKLAEVERERDDLKRLGSPLIEDALHNALSESDSLRAQLVDAQDTGNRLRDIVDRANDQKHAAMAQLADSLLRHKAAQADAQAHRDRADRAEARVAELGVEKGFLQKVIDGERRRAETLEGALRDLVAHPDCDVVRCRGMNPCRHCDALDDARRALGEDK